MEMDVQELKYRGTPAQHSTDNRISAKGAHYMELQGATKSADCSVVRVPQGVSTDKGLCYRFSAKSGAACFCCGDCTHVKQSREVKQP